MRLFFRCLLFTAMLAQTGVLRADEVQVAVASNFTKPMEKIAEQFRAETGHEAKLSFGSSGKFAAQISHGAPFEVFLSADASKPAKLLEQGLAVENTGFTYAQGRLALWSTQADYVDDQGEILKTGDFKHLSLADPKLAPYGEAAMQVLDNLQLTDQLRARFVQGENISQTLQFVKTGNAELGFVALSQIMQDGEISEGSAWIVPEDLYQPIRQDAVLLQSGKDSAAAKALLAFLQSEAAQAVISAFGYQLPASEDSQADAQ